MSLHQNAFNLPVALSESMCCFRADLDRLHFLFLKSLMSGFDSILEDLISQAASTGAIVKTTRSILQLLKDANVSITMRVAPNLIGVHKNNRDGLGVSGVDTMRLLANIFDLGFSETEVQAIAVEADDEDRLFNQRLMASCNLPPYSNICSVKFVSLSASHTNQALRCVLNGAAHDDPRMCIDGLLNVDKIEQKDRQLAEACRQGLMWTILPSHLFSKHPSLAQILQSAMNSSGQIARTETELQVLRKLHNFLIEEKRRSGPAGKVDFAEVKRKTLQSKPQCAGSLAHMFAFILKTSGGESADYLMESEAFLKTKECKAVPAEVYDVLSKDVPGTFEPFLCVRHALFKFACIIGTTAFEVKKLFSKDKLPLIQSAESLLREARTLVQQLSNAADAALLPKLVSVSGAFQMDIANKILRSDSRSSEFIAHLFWEEMAALTKVQLANRFTSMVSKEIEEHEKMKDKQTVEVDTSSLVEFRDAT